MKSKVSHKFKNFIICVVCVVFGCGATIPYLSYATTQDDVDQANSAVESLKAEQSSLSSDVSDLNSQVDSAGQKIADIDTKMDAKQDEISQLQTELDQLASQKQEQYQAMKLRIQYMYEHSTDDTFELLLKSSSLADLLVRTEYIQKISDYDRTKLQELENIISREQQAQTQLTSDMEQLTALKEQAAKELDNLKSLLATRQAQYNNSSKDVSQAEQQALQKEQELEKQKLEKQKAEEEQASREAASRAQDPSSQNPTKGSPVNYDASDLSMLAALIECEAANQPYQGMLAVGSVVINRVNSSRFPNSLAGVIYQSDQFSPVASGRFAIVLNRGANATCTKAAQEVLNGNIVISALYFHVYRPGIDTYGTVIGDHIFY